MAKKWKFFHHEFEWYDIKTGLKQALRKFAYSWIIQQLISCFIVAYMWLVYLSSKRKFVNTQAYLDMVSQDKSVLLVFWHNRLMMMPFIVKFASKKCSTNYKVATLASRHGDGQFVGKVMQKFGFQNIYGSSNHGRNKVGRGIDLHSVRELIRVLKSGKGLGITPDGPRGPNQKINSEIISLAKLSGAPILPLSYSTSRFIKINSWDKFKVPLPFSKLCFYFGDLIFVDRALDVAEEALLRERIEEKLNFVQDESWKNVVAVKSN